MNISAPKIRQDNLSIQVAVAISIITIATIAATTISAIVYFNIRQNLEDQFLKRVLNLATLAALTQQGNLHSTLVEPNDENSPNYHQLNNKNIAILNSDPDIGAIYTMRQDEKKNIYFVTYSKKKSLSDPNKTNPQLGDILKNTSDLLREEFTISSIAKVESNIYSNQWGSWLSAYAPFYGPDNQTLEGVVGIEVNKNSLITFENNILILILVLLILMVPILTTIGWITSIQLTKPIVDMANALSNISINNLNQPIINSNYKEINQLDQAISHIFINISTHFSKLEEKTSTNIIQLKSQTEEIEGLKRSINKRENQIKALAFVSQAILSVPNLDYLLPRISIVVSEMLSFYHIGIFLLDDAKEYAILTATNSAGGQKMIGRNHRLKVGEEGIVGYVAGVARPRIAHDTEKDIVFITNPDLAETHSELAIPLKIGLDIIGVLDIQSQEISAFTDEDVEIFSIFADYISIAIQNAQRFQKIQKSITESDTLYRNYLRQEWQSFTNQRKTPGYIYNISGSKPTIKKLETAEIQKAIQSGKPTTLQEKNQSHLSVPIKLRGQVIGVLNIQSSGNRIWKEDEIDIATAVADRVGLAVENARLLEDSQSRAARERTIGEITSKIGASINIRNVLQTAVEELGHVLPGSDVIIQLKDTKNKE